MPYKEICIYKYIFRLFYSKNDILYKWHYDKKTRDVFMISLGKWMFQEHEELPIPIKKFHKVHIERGQYHRLIRKSGILIAIIKQ